MLILTLVQILDILLQVAMMIMIIQMIFSWLLAFNVISVSNDLVRNLWLTLERITDPVYRPVRRIMPDFGALDLSPMVVLLAIIIMRRAVLPAIAASALGAA